METKYVYFSQSASANPGERASKINDSAGVRTFGTVAQLPLLQVVDGLFDLGAAGMVDQIALVDDFLGEGVAVGAAVQHGQLDDLLQILQAERCYGCRGRDHTHLFLPVDDVLFGPQDLHLDLVIEDDGVEGRVHVQRAGFALAAIKQSSRCLNV